MSQLPIRPGPLAVTQLWAFGDVLGAPRDLEHVDLVLGVDLPVGEVPWLTVPPGGSHWLQMTRLPKNPVVVWWRSAHGPVWNHRVVRPLLVWDREQGVREDAVEALGQGRGAASGLDAPSAVDLRARIEAELTIVLEALRVTTRTYVDRRWAPGNPLSYGDALADACEGYLDLLDARDGLHP